MNPTASVIIPTYNRPEKVKKLIQNLNSQSSNEFEVIVVNDGDNTTTREHICPIKTKFTLKYLYQSNCGPSAARQNGARESSGSILIFIDDDMDPCVHLVDEHIRTQNQGADVVLGKISTPSLTSKISSFELFHLTQLQKYYSQLNNGKISPNGPMLCTGNVSIRKSAFESVGGFDLTLARSEDRDLGIRLEKSGHIFAFNCNAEATHETDHINKQIWLERAFKYGISDTLIALKHRNSPTESYEPWRFLELTNPYLATVMALSYVNPEKSTQLAKALINIGETINLTGAHATAARLAGISYGIQYFCGVRHVEKPKNVTQTAWRQLAKRTKKYSTINLISRILTDHQRSIELRIKYRNTDEIKFDITRIGTQMSVMIRLMHHLKSNNMDHIAKIWSRTIRHMFGADIHWDAEISPGISIVHGNGLVISKNAVIGENCVLFQNVTIGDSIDPTTKQIGAPTLEENVHVGPGCCLLGPIRIGRNSKILAGSVITTNVPPNSRIGPAASRDLNRRQKSEVSQQ